MLKNYFYDFVMFGTLYHLLIISDGFTSVVSDTGINTYDESVD